MMQMASMLVFTVIALYGLYRIISRQNVSESFVTLCLANVLWATIYDFISIMAMYVGTKLIKEVSFDR